MTATHSLRKPTNQHERAVHENTLKKFLRSVSKEAMLGIVERAMIVFAQGQSVYNPMNYEGYEPIYEEDVSCIFDLFREEFLRTVPKLEESEPDILGGVGHKASAIWMKWYRDKHGVSLADSRDAGIRRRQELHGVYQK